MISASRTAASTLLEDMPGGALGRALDMPTDVAAGVDDRLIVAGPCRVTAFDRCRITVYGGCDITAYDECQITILADGRTEWAPPRSVEGPWAVARPQARPSRAT